MKKRRPHARKVRQVDAAGLAFCIAIVLVFSINVCTWLTELVLTVIENGGTP